MLGRALGTSPKNRPHGQPGHVGQIRLSDWSKFVILRSDWSVTKPTPFTTARNLPAGTLTSRHILEVSLALGESKIQK